MCTSSMYPPSPLFLLSVRDSEALHCHLLLNCKSSTLVKTRKTEDISTHSKKTFSLLQGSWHFLSLIAPFGWFDVVGNFFWRFTIFPSLFVFPARRRSFVLDLNRSKIVDQQSSYLFYSQPVQCSRTFWGTNFDGRKHIFIPFPPFLWNHRTKDVEIPLRHIKFELAKATTFMGNLVSSVIHPLRFEMSIYGTFKSFMPLRIQNPW